MALAVGANMLPRLPASGRSSGRPRPSRPSLDRYREAVTPIRTWLLVGVSMVIGLFAGASAVGQWREYLLWRNGVDFGSKDPYFKRDIGFYVFDLPWLHYLVDFAMAVAVISPDRRRGRALPVRRHPAAGRSTTGSPAPRRRSCRCCSGIFVLAKAADYWLDRFDLLNESGVADHRHHLHRRQRGAAGQATS